MRKTTKTMVVCEGRIRLDGICECCGLETINSTAVCDRMIDVSDDFELLMLDDDTQITLDQMIEDIQSGSTTSNEE